MLANGESESLAGSFAVGGFDIDAQAILAADRKKIFPVSAPLAQVEMHFLQPRAFDPGKVRREENARSRRVETNIHRPLTDRPTVAPGDQQRHRRRIGIRSKILNLRRGFEIDAEIFRPRARSRKQRNSDQKNFSEPDQ